MSRKNKEPKPEKVKKEKAGKKQKAQEEQEPQYYRSVTGEATLNYRVYYMKPLEKVLYFLLAAIVGAAVGYLFYGGLGKDEFGQPTMLTHILNAVIMVACGLISGKLFLPVRTKQILNSRKKKLKSQFRDMLEALSTALGAGKNMQDSFVSVEKDLANQYEEGAFILQELSIINTGVQNGFNMEEMLKDFARRSSVDDVQDFADVFEICYRQGGNIRETVKNTCKIISDKMSVAEEIETTLSGSKNEQYIMLVMPILLIGMIKVSSPDFASNFATPSGVIATTIGVVLFVVSYFLGTKLLDIKV